MVRATQSTLLTSQNCCGAPSSHPRCKTTVHRSLPELRRKAMQTYQPRELLFLSLSWLAPGLLPCVCKQMQSLALSWETRSFGFPPHSDKKGAPSPQPLPRRWISSTRVWREVWKTQPRASQEVTVGYFNSRSETIKGQLTEKVTIGRLFLNV